MKRQRWTIWGAVGLLGLLSLGLAGSSAALRADKPREEVFQGTALFVRLKNPERNLYLLEPQIKTVGERSFLIGRPVEGPVKLLRTWTPLADVTQIEEFTDAKEMAKWYKLPKAAEK